MPETKECVACAESIKSAASLCKHCGTMQDDEKFVKTAKTKRPKPASPKKSNCLSCEKPLGDKEPSLCNMCQFHVSKHELDLIALGMDIERCPVCATRFYAPEISSDCHVCEGRNDLSRRLLTSWWVQLIFVFVAIINPINETFSSPGVFFATIGGQLWGTNVFLALVLGLIYVAHGNGHKRAGKIKDWLLSIAAFFILGLLLTIFGYSIAL